jgi:hypothetical protein
MRHDKDDPVLRTVPAFDLGKWPVQYRRRNSRNDGAQSTKRALRLM